tara:strand:+ start:565 stop:837 length:273 start_codon:yes stop_codon:yes gene_type:complete
MQMGLQAPYIFFPKLFFCEINFLLKYLLSSENSACLSSLSIFYFCNRREGGFLMPINIVNNFMIVKLLFKTWGAKTLQANIHKLSCFVRK